MATDIYIFSGFLGAGKTTLIQKLLREAFGDNKVVVIENDFGDISIDAALLKTGGVEVKEMNSGCICCSLSGDFVKALVDLLDRFDPDTIIIEPSGVGKLSDIAEACSDARIRPRARIKTKITAVDVKRCKMYLDNFGEFFEDQIQYADVVVLSRTEDFPDRVSDACKLVKSLNGHCAILSKPWDQISAKELLHPDRHRADDERHSHTHGAGHHHDDEHCDHDHSADDIFDTVTVRTNRVYSIDDLKKRVFMMEQNAQGTILRAKGIVRSTNGFINLQYLPGDIRITRCAAGGDSLCIIGRSLNRQELARLFDGT